MEHVEEDLNLSYLLEHERTIILRVLQKDEKLRKREEKRIRKLKNELLEIKRRGTRRPQEPEERQCARCLKSLGLIFGRGDVCKECQLRVCDECRVETPKRHQWICNVCAKISELKVVTGEWFMEERSKRFEPGVASSDVIKQTIMSNPIGEFHHRCPVTQNRTIYIYIITVMWRLKCAHHHDVHRTWRQSSVSYRLFYWLLVLCLYLPSGPSLPSNHFVLFFSHRPASLSCLTAPDHSRSEMDLSAPGSEPSDDAFSLRSRSVPGLNDMLLFSLSFSTLLFHASYLTCRVHLPLTFTPSLISCLYAEQSSINSMMSMYSETGDYGNARVSGEILLNISYSYKTGALNVLVKECHNLATGDERRQRTDTYVKTYLLPDMSRQSKRKTSIKANTINPVFNESLRYVISHSQLETRTLQVSVWHHDRFGHNSFLGEVELTFDSWEFDSQIEDWYSLLPKADSNIDSSMHYKGELTVVLKYIPAEKNLTLPLDQVQGKKSFLKSKKASSFTLPKGGMVELLVKGAKNLTAVKSGGTSDPFVKGYLLPDSNKSTKHKTVVERRTVNPQWNHTFTYCGLQPGDLNNVCLELTVWDKEALASNVFLGGVRLGAGSGTSYGNEVDWMDSYGEEQRLWQRMIENPEVPHECTLMLRSSMRKCST
uniref:Synaptotagmin-like protein 5 n=1 Tax=Cyclopterus lumpus TaxID=8103 RepID=A0A8C2YYF9_CYCLU